MLRVPPPPAPTGAAGSPARPAAETGPGRRGETAAPRLAVLERSLFIAAAVRGADSVSYTAYRVT